MFTKMMDQIRGQKKKLAFPEGADPRILLAAQKLVEKDLAVPVLLGDIAKIKEAASQHDVSLDGMELIDPATDSRREEFVAKLVEIRKGKMDEAASRQALEKTNYYGTMLVKTGYAQGLLGGATYSTADTVRPALQIIKTKPGCKSVSSCFILSRMGRQGEERYAMGDCAINIDPDEDTIVEIAIETAKTARMFNVEPKVALLSFSSLGSGKGESAEKMQKASAKLKEMTLDFPVDGELQFDAAFSAEVAKTKAPDSPVAGQANTFIFPNIDAGNIGYKMAQRLGGFEAFGPILLGMNAPINDLSRGCVADEVYKMSIITLAQAE